MKTRIKVVESDYHDLREYYPQYRKWGVWRYFMRDGSSNIRMLFYNLEVCKQYINTKRSQKEKSLKKVSYIDY